jgi:hypothetical protein
MKNHAAHSPLIPRKRVRVKTPSAVPTPAEHPLARRFWGNVKKNPSTGCWEWTGNKVGPYGVLFHHNSKRKSSQTTMASRLSYEIHHGSISDAMSLTRTCGNKGCINPDHLTPYRRKGGGPKEPAPAAPSVPAAPAVADDVVYTVELRIPKQNLYDHPDNFEEVRSLLVQIQDYCEVTVLQVVPEQITFTIEPPKLV